jgi:hypothetical protein
MRHGREFLNARMWIGWGTITSRGGVQIEQETVHSPASVCKNLMREMETERERLTINRLATGNVIMNTADANWIHCI